MEDGQAGSVESRTASWGKSRRQENSSPPPPRLIPAVLERQRRSPELLAPAVPHNSGNSGNGSTPAPRLLFLSQSCWPSTNTKHQAKKAMIVESVLLGHMRG